MFEEEYISEGGYSEGEGESEISTGEYISGEETSVEDISVDLPEFEEEAITFLKGETEISGTSLKSRIGKDNHCRSSRISAQIF